MPHIGLRHLKTHASEVIKDVQENQARYTITNRGQPVALLIPYSRAGEPGVKDPREAWRELIELLQEAGRTSQSTETTEEIMDWLRRY